MTTAADPANYPSARKGRGTGKDVEALGPFSAPRTRVFPFFFTFIGNRRRSFSTPRIQGPAIIKGLELYNSFGSSPPQLTVEVGLALQPVLEDNVLNSVPRPYETRTELIDPFAAMGANAGRGFPIHTLPTITSHYEHPLDLIVEPGSWFVVVACVNPTAFAAEFSGSLRVIEAVDQEALRFFL